MRFISLAACGSTNAQARKLAEAGDIGPLWIRAGKQTAGRGRRGREWKSVSGNLYCTGLYAHHGGPQQAAQHSFVAALAVYDVISAYISADLITLKWPNDVLINGEKTSGILLETGSFKDQPWLAVGIGINLVSHPDAVEFPATHILAHISEHALSGPEPVMTGPDAALAILAARFDHWRHILLTSGFGAIGAAWTNRAHNIPGPVRVRLPQEEFSGQALGLGENGELQVRLSNGSLRNVHAGDVFF